MNAYLILVGLLVLAYAGSALFRGRSIQGYGLPSGTEYLVLGVAVGPIGLATLTRSTLSTFEPLAVTALSWLTFVAGANLGFAGERSIARRRTAASIGLGALCVGVAAGATWLVVPSLFALDGQDRLFMALGVGCACGETTRAAVRWVVERHGARGPLTDLVSDLSEADDSVPFLGLAILFAIGPTPEGAVFAVPPWAGLLATLMIGLVLGATASALADVETRRTERWGILLGTALLNTGVTMRLGLSAPSSMFAMGVALAAFSKHGRDLRAMLSTTERPVMLPALVLAGAHLDLRDGVAIWSLVGIALLGRLLAKGAGGLLLAKSSDAAARSTPFLGLAMLSSGALTACVGLATALRFPGPVGRAVLATSIASGVLGEILGPFMLRRELRAAGEIVDPSRRTPIPASRLPPSLVARTGRRGIVPARARSRASNPSNPDRGSMA